MDFDSTLGFPGGRTLSPPPSELPGRLFGLLSVALFSLVGFLCFILCGLSSALCLPLPPGAVGFRLADPFRLFLVPVLCLSGRRPFLVLGLGRSHGDACSAYDCWRTEKGSSP